MTHPIHQANEKSPFGDLTREEFYKKHQISHQESFMLNKDNLKIFTQSWKPADSATHPRGLVGIIHGYSDESSWLIQLNAVAIAKAGFHVHALDLQGHGYSEGLPCHIPNIGNLVEDCIQLFDSARASQPELPAFLFGESLGGAIAILVCLKQVKEWNGLVLNGAMCGVSKKFKPIWPLEELLPLAAYIAPTWNVSITEDPVKKSYKEEWKRRLAMRSPNRPPNAKVTAATALESLRVCDYIQRHCHGLKLPLLLVHGEDDKICDPESARFVYKSAQSGDKTLRIFEGMWHQFIGEPNESIEIVSEIIISWIGERADKARANSTVLMVSTKQEKTVV